MHTYSFTSEQHIFNPPVKTQQNCNIPSLKTNKAAMWLLYPLPVQLANTFVPSTSNYMKLFNSLRAYTLQPSHLYTRHVSATQQWALF